MMKKLLVAFVVLACSVDMTMDAAEGHGPGEEDEPAPCCGV